MKKISLSVFVFSVAIGAFPQSPGLLNPLQGGENEATAFLLSGTLPIISSGTTSGYLDDYDEICPDPGSTAPDVVYKYIPSAGMTVDIDLCGSEFDTKISVYENSVIPGFAVACNDDFYYSEPCGLYVSKIENLILTMGTTYFIVIDGYSGMDFGNYSLELSETELNQCTWGVDIVCPPWGVEENETCGTNTNGGCDMIPGSESWELVPSNGATICGTTWADSGDQDSDWFELTLTEASAVSLTANADVEIFYGLVETTTPGAPACNNLTGEVNPSNIAGPCVESFLDLGILDPGTYWFYLSMTVTEGFPCTNHYRIDFEVNALQCPSPEALYATNITPSSADLGWIETGSSTSWEYEYGPVYFTPTETGTVTNSNPVTISGLESNTQYDYYVRAICNEFDSSTWTGPFTFTSECDGTTVYPWSEGFESTWPPACWSDPDASAYGWDQSNYGFEHSGSEWAYCNKTGAVLTSPEFFLPENAWLVFYFKAENASDPQDLTVKAGNDVIYQVIGAINEEYQQAMVSLSSYIGQVISVSFTGATGSGGTDAGICMDDVSVKSGFNWTGNISTSWENPGNWNIADIPGQDDIVLIPSAPSGGRFPEVNNSITAECYSIKLEAGASIDVNTGGHLNVRNP